MNSKFDLRPRCIPPVPVPGFGPSVPAAGGGVSFGRSDVGSAGHVLLDRGLISAIGKFRSRKSGGSKMYQYLDLIWRRMSYLLENLLLRCE